MRKGIILFAVLMLCAVPVSANVCIQINPMCEKFDLTDQGGGLYKGTGDGCQLGIGAYPAYFQLQPGGNWLMVMDFDNQGLPLDPNAGDFAWVVGLGFSGSLRAFISNNFFGPIPVTLEICDFSLFYMEDFSQYPPGPFAPGGDWTVLSLGGSLTVLAPPSDAGSGNVLELDDSSVYGDWVYALYWKQNFTEMNDGDFTFSFDYYGTPDLTIINLYQDKLGAKWGETETFLYTDGTQLSAWNSDTSAVETCGVTLLPSTWYTISFDVTPTLGSGMYSIYVDGAFTSCVDFPFMWSDGPLAGYRLLGYATDGSGGIGLFDNIQMYR